MCDDHVLLPDTLVGCENLFHRLHQFENIAVRVFKYGECSPLFVQLSYDFNTMRDETLGVVYYIVRTESQCGTAIRAMLIKTDFRHARTATPM